MLRAFELHLSINDLEELTHGDVIDMIIEHSNDYCDWDKLATQEDFDAFTKM